MPKAKWGITSRDVDDFDRSSQFVPYAGPIPPDAVYNWKIKVLKSISATKDKLPQLRVGLELMPRGASEDKYEGYFVYCFLPVAESTKFRYVPFLDAIGVSGREFVNGTVTDEEGNITKIGRWRNSGDELIGGQLKTGQDQNNEPRKEIGWMGEALDDFDEGDEIDDDDYEIDDDDYDDDEDD